MYFQFTKKFATFPQLICMLRFNCIMTKISFITSLRPLRTKILSNHFASFESYQKISLPKLSLRLNRSRSWFLYFCFVSFVPNRKKRTKRNEKKQNETKGNEILSFLRKTNPSLVVYEPFLNLCTTVIAPNYDKKGDTCTYKKPHEKSDFIKSNTFFPLIYQE